MQSKLVRNGNNPFGIKGKGQKTLTKEYINGSYVTVSSSFASFESFGKAVEYLVDLLSRHRRYEKARKAITGEAFLRELQRAGYATSPDWFERFTIPTYKQIINYAKGIKHRK